jgi:hypothetical protein
MMGCGCEGILENTKKELRWDRQADKIRGRRKNECLEWREDGGEFCSWSLRTGNRDPIHSGSAVYLTLPTVLYCIVPAVKVWFPLGSVGGERFQWLVYMFTGPGANSRLEKVEETSGGSIFQLNKCPFCLVAGGTITPFL